MITTNKARFVAMPLATITALGAVTPVFAQGTFAQRHHKAVGLAAGYAAYKAAKVTGRNRKSVGRHRNFAQRHPYLTGIAAGVAANHFAKKRR